MIDNEVFVLIKYKRFLEYSLNKEKFIGLLKDL
jgi:hypothetical protein